MNKKGQTKLIMPIFKVLLVIFVLFLILYKIFSIYDSDAYAIKATAVDAPLLVDSLISSSPDMNADVLFSFPVKSSVRIDRKESSIEFVKGILSATYFFRENPDVRVESAKFEDVNSFYMIKNGNKLSFSRIEPAQISLYTCPKINVRFNRIIFDASIKDDFGLTAVQYLSQYFEHTLQERTVQPDNLKLIQEKIMPGDFLVSIRQGNFQGSLIKAYVNPNEISVALACNLLNTLIEDFNVENAAIIPVNLEFLLEKDPKNILNIAAPAILLEIGKDNTQILEYPETFVNSINKGVEKFV